MRSLFIVIFIVLCIKTLPAQSECKYYALTKTIIDDNQSVDVSGGQFITFINNICFESDKKGIGVGHGTLQLNRNYNNSNFKIYTGNSYWGTAAIFKFSYDLSILNVITDSGDVYVYKRSEAPSSATTSSLIRKNHSTVGAEGLGIPLPAVPNQNNVSNTISIGSDNRNNENNSREIQKTKHTCSLCHGNKRIVKDTYPSLFGTKDYQVRCNECGGYYLRSTGHTHITCPQCHGKGYFTTD